MTEQELSTDDRFDEGLETGYDIASQEIQEQIENILFDEGFDDEEIEALFDPASKRRRRRSKASAEPARRRRKSRKGRSRGRSRGYGKRVSGALGKFQKYAFPVAAGGTFIMQYAARADALKASGAITTGGYGGILEALKYDLTNFNASDAMTRVSSNLSTIGVPLVGGWAVKKFLGGKGDVGAVASLVGDLAMGYGTGIAVKKILDPPVQAVAPRKPCPQGNCNGTTTTTRSIDPSAPAGWRV